MNVMEMKKKDFRKVPLMRKGPFPEFDALVIIPKTKDEPHESGYLCMEFCLVKNSEPIARIGGYSDVIDIDGIGGRGKQIDGTDWVNLPSMVRPKNWRIDCLPCGYLQLWNWEMLFLEDEYVLSTLEIFSKPKRKDD